MGLSRRQLSQQVTYLFNGTGLLGSAACIETALAVEDLLTSGLPFPMAAAQTMETLGTPGENGRIDPSQFKISIVAQAATEAPTSNYVASGGSLSSAHALETVVQSILVQLNSNKPGSFNDSKHGFQGFVDRIHQQRIVVTVGLFYVATDIDITIQNETYQDYYHIPTHFSASPGSSHTISLSWNNPPDRFDKYQNILRRGATPGAPAPTSYNGGGDTGISITGGVLGTSATDTLAGSGLTYNYSLFHLYSSGAAVSGRALATATTT